jgi:hypothetical protein
MRFVLIALIAMIPFAAFGATPEFEEGQAWAYKTRAGEEELTLLINKIEDHPKLGRIYQISVTNLSIKAGPGLSTNRLPHLPVSRQTLELSCTKLVGRSEPNSMYLPGYQMWKQAFDAGHAGIYTISVAEIVDLAEKMLQEQAPAADRT